MVDDRNHWFRYGGMYKYGLYAGMFVVGNECGRIWDSTSFRIVLSI